MIMFSASTILHMVEQLFSNSQPALASCKNLDLKAPQGPSACPSLATGSQKHVGPPFEQTPTIYRISFSYSTCFSVNMSSGVRRRWFPSRALAPCTSPPIAAPAGAQRRTGRRSWRRCAAESKRRPRHLFLHETLVQIGLHSDVSWCFTKTTILSN